MPKQGQPVPVNLSNSENIQNLEQISSATQKNASIIEEEGLNLLFNFINL